MSDEEDDNLIEARMRLEIEGAGRLKSAVDILVRPMPSNAGLDYELELVRFGMNQLAPVLTGDPRPIYHEAYVRLGRKRDRLMQRKERLAE